MDIIRLSVQPEPHGSNCTSLKEIFVGNKKKTKKGLQSGLLWRLCHEKPWVMGLINNNDSEPGSFLGTEVPFVPAYVTGAKGPPLNSLGKVHCLQLSLN